MTMAEAVRAFTAEVLPLVRENERGGIDRPARREAWVNYVDALVKGGSVSEARGGRWGHPRNLFSQTRGGAL
jgi:hypothetical protein